MPWVKKELRPFHDAMSCDVCGRTILKGERTEAYLAPGGHRHHVCALCFVRAENAGWIRESAADQVPTRAQRPQERRSLRLRFRRRGDEPAANGTAPAEQPDDELATEHDLYPAPELGDEAEEPPAPPAEQRRRRSQPPQDPRHVRAVPTTAEVKVERALELFNASEHQRTIAGLTRSLGYPWATAVPDTASPSVVTLVVAWELSWYRYRIDLGDTADPVSLQDKGDELEDIEQELRNWNAAVDEDGRLVVEGGAVT